jgi:hypothetical protein
MSDRVNSQIDVTPNGDIQAPAQVARRMEQVKNTFRAGMDRARPIVKKHPWAVGAAVAAVLAAGYGLYPSSDKLVPVAEAGLPAAAPSKTRSTGEVKEVEMVVGSFLKRDGFVVLNNHADHKQATMSAFIDLKAAPELAAVNFRALKGQTVSVRGEYQTYNEKPQIKVTRAADLKLDASKVEKKGS